MISVLIPTRNRPDGLNRFAQSADAKLYIGLQNNDPKENEYQSVMIKLPEFMFGVYENIGLVKKTNNLLKEAIAKDDKNDFFFGADDIEIMTPDWKEIFSKKIDELEKEHGHRFWILYGDDGIQGEKLPTHPLITNELARLLGWFWPPHFKHLFTDNAIKHIGTECGILRYVPEVKMKHHHFIKDPSLMDKNYAESNSSHAYSAAKSTFEMWREVIAPSVIKKIKLNIQKP